MYDRILVRKDRRYKNTINRPKWGTEWPVFPFIGYVWNILWRILSGIRIK